MINLPIPTWVVIIFGFLNFIQVIRFFSLLIGKQNKYVLPYFYLWGILALAIITFLSLDPAKYLQISSVLIFARENSVVFFIIVIIIAEMFIRYCKKLDLSNAKNDFLYSLDPDIRYKAIYKYELYGEYNIAIRMHRQFIKENPIFFKSYVNLAALLGRQGNYQEAETLCKKSIEIEPDYSNAHFFLSMALRDRKMKLEAIREFKISIELGLPEPLRSEAIYQIK